MTSMWMVQNDDGRYLDWTEEFNTFNAGYAFNHDDAVHRVRAYGGHLVEMVPAKPKVPVSQEEAEMLRKAGADGYSVGKTIVDFVNNAGLDTVICSDENLLQHEDRLMRAYVDGYTVTEPTKYNVKVPHVQTLVYCRDGEGGLVVTDVDTINGAKFTLEQIKAYKLQDCERVEINAEDSDD